MDTMIDLPVWVQAHLPELAIAGALAWGAGLRLYMVLLIFGLAAAMGWWQLPEHLNVLAHPIVLMAAALMALVEGFADKIPFIDSVWDAAHTLIRIPAGAALAAAAFGDSGTAITVAAALLGGAVTATTHLSKSATRAAANTSPEPVSNVLLSLGEDAAVVGGSWLAISYPSVFLVGLLIFLVVMVFLIRFVVRAFQRFRAGGTAAQTANSATSANLDSPS